MRLDRNITNPKRGKYALIKLREAGAIANVTDATDYVPVLKSAIDFGDTDDTDFFVIRLKDKYAYKALIAYALAAAQDDEEYAGEITELAIKAVRNSSKKRPD